MRTGWVVWCVLWAFFWITIGWLIFPVINLALFLFSIIAIFFAYVIPKERRWTPGPSSAGWPRLPGWPC
jgi:hypothetical protein